MRNFSYDSLPLALTNLKLATEHSGKMFLKAKESKKLDSSAILEGVNADKSSDALCRLIYSQFCALRNDYLTSQVNTARYTANLKPLKDFLDDNPKINNPSLNRAEILKEANLYVSGSFQEAGTDGSGKVTPLA